MKNSVTLAIGEAGTKIIKIKISEASNELSSYINKWIDYFYKGNSKRHTSSEKV